MMIKRINRHYHIIKAYLKIIFAGGLKYKVDSIYNPTGGRIAQSNRSRFMNSRITIFDRQGRPLNSSPVDDRHTEHD